MSKLFSHLHGIEVITGNFKFHNKNISQLQCFSDHAQKMKISEQAVFVYMITYGASDHFLYSLSTSDNSFYMYATIGF